MITFHNLIQQWFRFKSIVWPDCCLAVAVLSLGGGYLMAIYLNKPVEDNVETETGMPGLWEYLLLIVLVIITLTAAWMIISPLLTSQFR
jgi:hypothetical protein